MRRKRGDTGRESITFMVCLMEKEKSMRFKNKWLNRVTAAVLSIGMALTPVVMNSGVTYADVKDIESPIPVTQSEEAKKLLTKTVTISGSNYDITAELSCGESSMKVDETQEVEIILTSSAADATSSNAIASASNTFKWSANDGKVEIADVSTSSNGTRAKVTAKEAGETGVTVTATVAGEEFNVPYNITVEAAETPVVPVEEVKLDKTKLVLFVGRSRETEKLNVTPQNGKYKWQSSDEKVATVSSNGTVEASNSGTATVTVKDENTGKTASCEVTVVKIDPTSDTYILEAGKEVTVNITTEPKGIDVYQYASFSSSDEKVASVTGSSTIKALKEGTTDIALKRGNVTLASIEVIVASKDEKNLIDVNEVDVDIKDAGKLKVDDPNGYMKSMSSEEIQDLKKAKVDKVSEEFDNNMEAWSEARNLIKAVRLPLKENQRALLRVASVLTDMELKMRDASSLYPTKLVFTSEINADYFDADTGVRTDEDQKVDNKSLTGDTIYFNLPIPSEITEKYAQVIHKSAGYKDGTIANLEIKNHGTANAYIEVPVTHFSTFEVTFTDEKVPVNNGNSGSNSSSGGSSSSGSTYRGTKKTAQWARDAKGWRFQNADGTYVTNRWIELSWKEKSAWYRFNEQGYMMTGWFKDADNNWYFMNDRADGTQGSMVTGWRQIAGKWYYFRVTAGGPKGSLVVNATTPDGYKVDGNGAWIQ